MFRYTFCLLMFSLNGASEGYVRAKAGPKELRKIQIFAFINSMYFYILKNEKKSDDNFDYDFCEIWANRINNFNLYKYGIF